MDEAEREVVDDYDRQYRLVESSVRRRVEESVLGAEYGANGYTTVVQAHELAVRLRLGPGVSLLDLGAGSGWPGLYLADATGCRAVLADLPIAGLRIAKRRALGDGIAERCDFVRASGDRLPFQSRSFDAITHTDVFC